MKNIGVFAIVKYDDKILLEKRNYGNYGWTLPGGAVENGESLEDALKREVKEETNQSLKSLEYRFISYSPENYSVAFIYKAEIFKLSEIKFNQNELSDVRWFSINELPKELSDRQRKWLLICENFEKGVIEI